MIDTEASVVPTLVRSSKTFTTRNPEFAAVLITDGTLPLESWDQSAHAGVVEFYFADPEGRGRALELAYETGSRESRLFSTRKYLVNKVFEITRGANRAKQSR